MKLSTTTTGDGERHVALVHGLGADGTTWKPLVDRLVPTGSYTVTTVDLRGHGHSDRAASYGLGEFASDVVGALPTGLHGVVGHSLGGSVLVRAVARLQPQRAVYLDPGFQLAIPTTGFAGRMFWAVPQVTLGLAGLAQARKSAKLRAKYEPGLDELITHAQKRFDSEMAVGILRDVAHGPVKVAPPVVPSVIVLSDDSPAVLSDALAARLEDAGWGIRRLPGVHHDMHLEAPDRTFELVRELV